MVIITVFSQTLPGYAKYILYLANNQSIDIVSESARNNSFLKLNTKISIVNQSYNRNKNYYKSPKGAIA